MRKTHNTEEIELMIKEWNERGLNKTAIKFGVTKMTLCNYRNQILYPGKTREEIKEITLQERIKSKIEKNDGYIHVNLKNADNCRNYFFADLLQRGWSMEKLFHFILKNYYSVSSNRPFIKEYEELKKSITNKIKL